MPFTVGGGIRNKSDIRDLLNAGADKVSLNTSAVRNPGLISNAARTFGSQCIVVAIDRKIGVTDGKSLPTVAGLTGKDALQWARHAVAQGAGEILLTSMDYDGTKDGYDIALTRLISQSVSVPVIASGGAGNLKDFLTVFKIANADAALAASIFHYGEFTVSEVKTYLKKKGILVRL